MSTYRPKHVSSSYRERLTSPPPHAHKHINASRMQRGQWRCGTPFEGAPCSHRRREGEGSSLKIILLVAEHRNFPMSFIPQIIQFSQRPGRIAYYITVHLISKDTLTTPLGNNDTCVRCVSLAVLGRWQRLHETSRAPPTWLDLEGRGSYIMKVNQEPELHEFNRLA